MQGPTTLIVSFCRYYTPRAPYRIRYFAVTLRHFMWALAPALLLGRAIEVQTPQHEPESEPSWAFPVRDQALAEADDSELKHVPGSSKAYTQRQIDDSSSPPDWFPDEHAPMSEVVKTGVANRCRHAQCATSPPAWAIPNPPISRAFLSRISFASSRNLRAERGAEW